MDHSVFDPAPPVVAAVDLIEFCNIGAVELVRDGKVIERREFKNDVVTIGKNSILDAFFNAGTQPANWYIGIIDNDAFVTLSSTDTSASHLGWHEFLGYTATGRLLWGQGNAVGGQVINGTVLTATINVGGILQGIFVISDGTKGGTTGILWATALFTVPLTVSNGDTLNLTYAIQM